MNAAVVEPLEYFTDREVELAAYDSLWTTNSNRILCLDGLSGIGKSTLLDYLVRRHAPHRPVVLINLENRRLHAGYEFVAALATRLRRLFPALSWRPYEEAQRRADEEGRHLRALPTVNMPIQQEQAVRGRNSTISESSQAVHVSLDALTTELDRRITEHERRSRSRLLDALCSILGLAEPFAVLVDTYEAAAHAADRDFADWFNHEFLPMMELQVPAARLVLAGREDLPGRLPKATIGRWSRQDSDRFLASRGRRYAGLGDPEVTEAVFAHCRGHPLVTSLAADVWENGQASGMPLLSGQLREAANERAAVRWLMTELYPRLPDGLSEIVRIAVRLREYRPELMNRLLTEEESGQLDADKEAKLAALSLSEQLPGGGFRAHDLVREVEDAWFRRRSAEYRQFHLTAAEHCQELGDLPGFLYHGIAADEENFAIRWFSAVEERRLGLRRIDVENLIGLLEAPERRSNLQPGTLGLLRFEQALLARSHADFGPSMDQPARGGLAQAENLLRESVRSFHEARSAWGVATASQALGDLQLRTARLAAAEESYGQALELFQRIEERLGEANTLQSLGDLQLRTDRLAAAEESYGQALELYRQVEARSGEANTLKALGDLQVRTARLAAAEESYGQALELFQRIEDRLGEANTLQALGRFFSVSGENGKAEDHFAAALEIFESVGSRYSAAATLAYRGQHRTANRDPNGFVDWRRALDVAAMVDSYQLGQVVAITLGDARRMLLSGDADDYLAEALPALINAGDAAAKPPSQEQDVALTLALAGFAIIHDLALIKIAVPPGNADRSRLADAARKFDGATGAAFGLAAVAEQILLQADAKAAAHPLANLAAAWIGTPTWRDSENFLVDHGELLSDDGHAAIAALAENSPDSDTLALHANLLDGARRDGVAAAYAQLRAELAMER